MVLVQRSGAGRTLLLMPKETLKYLLVAALVLLGFLSGVSLRTPDSPSLQGLLAQQAMLNQQVSVVSNRNLSLEKLLKESIEKQNKTAAAIAGLGKQATKTQYVAAATTTLKGEETKADELPTTHEFLLNGEIPIARFDREDDGYVFRTHDLSLTTTIALSPSSTSVIVTGKSTGAPGRTFQLPTTVDVVRVPEPVDLFEPHILIGGTIVAPTLDVGVSGTLPLLHPHRNVDLLAPRVSVSRDRAYLGVDGIGYNIGAPLPIVQDIWVYGGVSVSTELTPYASITIGSKL